MQKSKATVRLGYPCMNLSLSNSKTRTVTQKTMQGLKDKEAAWHKLLDIGNHNLATLYRVLDWNYLNQVSFFRIYSDLFPHMSNANLSSFVGEKRCQEYRDLVPFEKEIKKIGVKLFEYGVRATFHPNEYSCLGSDKQEVLELAVRDLDWQAKMVRMFEDADPHRAEEFKKHFKDSVLVMHGGGQYGDKKATLKRWAKTYKNMPEYLRKRLVIENDERNYSPLDLVDFCEEHSIPMVVDFFHQDCYELMHPDEDKADWSTLLPRTTAVWHQRDMIPKYHVSEQQPDRRIGTHSHFAFKLPDCLLHRQSAHPTEHFDIMLECKMKDLALMKTRSLYPGLETLDAKNEEWTKKRLEKVKLVNNGKMPDLSELDDKEKGALVEGVSHSVKPAAVYKAKTSEKERSRSKSKKCSCANEDIDEDVDVDIKKVKKQVKSKRK